MKKMHKSSIKVILIGNLIELAVLLLVIIGMFAVSHFWFELPKFILIGAVVLYIIYIIDSIWWDPRFQYKYFEYMVDEERIEVKRGFFTKEHAIVPLFTVQNVESHQGPIMKKYHLKTIEVVTAEQGVSIPMISADEAARLKDMIYSKIRVKDNVND